MFSNFINGLYESLGKISFDVLMYIIFGSYAAIFLIAVIASIFFKKIRAASKRPYLLFTNCYAALTLAAFLTGEGLGQSVMAAALFWIIGYLTYGVLCLFNKKQSAAYVAKEAVVSGLPVQQVKQPEPVQNIPKAVNQSAPKTSVRLEHAVAVTEKLLTKNLSKTDRLELEKLKNTLAVLQIKGTLSPAEGEILNENFNALLKLMAKYNV